MKIFLAGAGGAIGRQLTPLLRSAGHAVFGTTRAADKAGALRALGAEPVVVDVFDAQALARAVQAAAPDVVLHHLTALAFAPGTPQYEEGLARNARPRIESDPLNLHAEGAVRKSAEAVAALEQAVLSIPEGIVLRYGYFYGPGTWSGDVPSRQPSVHVD